MTLLHLLLTKWRLFFIINPKLNESEVDKMTIKIKAIMKSMIIYENGVFLSAVTS